MKRRYIRSFNARAARPGDHILSIEEAAILDGYTGLAAMILVTALNDAAQLDSAAMEWLQGKQAAGLAESLDLDPGLLGQVDSRAVWETESYYRRRAA